MRIRPDLIVHPTNPDIALYSVLETTSTAQLMGAELGGRRLPRRPGSNEARPSSTHSLKSISSPGVVYAGIGGEQMGFGGGNGKLYDLSQC